MNPTTKTWSEEQILSLLKKASPDKKQEVIDKFNALIQFNEETMKEAAHPDGIHCPQCGKDQHGHIVGNGRIKPGSPRQRYLCRGCGGTFNTYTTTVFHKTKKLDAWPAFLQCMLKGLSIREIAIDVGISPTTAHAWRKKVLDHMIKHMAPILSGIVEVSECEINYSNKGQQIENASIARKQKKPVTLVFCKSRAGAVYVGCTEELKQKLLDKQHHIRWYTTDKKSSILPVNCSTDFARVELSLLHTNHVKPIMRRFTESYATMRGVATKYLSGYTAWHQFISQTHGLTPGDKMNLLLRSCT